MIHRAIIKITLLSLLASSSVALGDVRHPSKPPVPEPGVTGQVDPLGRTDWTSGQSESTKGVACGWGLSPEEVLDERADVAVRVANICSALGVDPALALSVAYQESRLNQNCVAPRTRHSLGQRAEGVMQVLPSTGRGLFAKSDLGSYDGRHEGHNIVAGCLYLKEGSRIADGSAYHIAGGYHAGYGHKVWRDQLSIPRAWPKTRDYAAKVSANWYPVFQNLLRSAEPGMTAYSPTPVKEDPFTVHDTEAHGVPKRR